MIEDMSGVVLALSVYAGLMSVLALTFYYWWMD